MGLGKTLEMISLILKHKELEAERGNRDSDKVSCRAYFLTKQERTLF
jgi:hypothetical protein